MDIKNLKEQLQKSTQLSISEQFQLRKDVLRYHPELLRPWYWFRPCVVNVLIVVDGLDFSTNSFGLSGFLSIFKKMEQESNVHITYKVTLADRRNVNINGNGMQGGNPDFANRISTFRFNNPQHFTDTKYDQVWLFGIASAVQFPSALNNQELSTIESYMDKGGGLFATGDHGALGRSLCGNIIRVKDMRHWNDTNTDQNLNEVSMGQRRRNDTNQPPIGNTTSTSFNDQSDNIPQTISPKIYNGLPHPLLSIKTTLVSSGIIQQMPDHPHEGECKPEVDFTVTNPRTGLQQTIKTQNIAISFVNAGNTSGGKDATDPHCFPSISVFDGRLENIGRIAIDSTWHHFVNINLQGLLPNTLGIVEEYYKNISKWMTRRKNMLCLFKRVLVLATLSERIMESSMNNPHLKLSEIEDHELYAIGEHAIDFVSKEFNPALGLQFTLTLLEPLIPEFVKNMDPWIVVKDQSEEEAHNQWTNPKGILSFAMGTGIVKIKEILDKNLDKPITQDIEEELDSAFLEGAKIGIEKGLKSFQNKIEGFTNSITKLTQEDHRVFGKITDLKGGSIPDLTIKAVDKDFTGENLLGSKTLTKKDGSYSINYRQTDFVIKGKESGGADIILYIFDQKGKLIHKTDINHNSPKETKINIKL